MAIGDQADGTTEATLRKRYEDVIRDAILGARPGIEVKRSDDSNAGGSITDEVLEDLLLSDYVVADVSYPNPNVFYELGLRHAAHAAGTLLLRHRDAPKPPFDINVLRYSPYDDTSTGVKALVKKLTGAFDYVDSEPRRPDNQFQMVASRLAFSLPSYGQSPYKERTHDVEMLAKLFTSPTLLRIFEAQQAGEQLNPVDLFRAFAEDPEAVKVFLNLYMTAGNLDVKSLLKM